MRRSYSTALYLALLALVVAHGYVWSLRHFHRADQWWFLIDTMDAKGFWETFRACYSWDRMTQIALANPVLFRPLLFAFLSAQKAAFGNAAWLYQATSVVLHFGICAQFFFLLRFIVARTSAHPSLAKPLRVLAHLLPLFVAGNINLAESVLWAHLNGYLVFYLLTLSALMAVMKACEGTCEAGRRRLWIMTAWGLVLFGSFFMEYGQYFALAVGGVVCASLPRGTRSIARAGLLVAFCAIPAIYQAANQWDKRQHAYALPAQETQARPILREPFEPAAWRNTFYYLKFTTLSPCFPSDAEARLLDHGRLLMSQVSIGALARSFTGGLGGLVVGAATVLAAFGAVRLRRERGPGTLAAGVAFLCFALYGAGIVLVRMRTVGPDYLESYYSYWPFVSALLVAFSCWCAAARGLHDARMVKGASLVLACLAGWIAMELPVSLLRLRQLEKVMAARFQEDNEFVRAVGEVIRVHVKEPGFGLAFDYAHSEGVSIPLMHGIPIATILFRAYENPAAPSHILVQHGGSVDALTVAEYRKAYPEACTPPFPRLVHAGGMRNVYLYRDEYYSLSRLDGYFDPSRKDYSSLSRAATLEEALDQ